MMKKTLIVVLQLITLHSFSQSIKSNVYLFSYFRNNGEDGLHLAYSEDGYTYTALNNDSSFLRPQIGNEKLMRDPCIIKGPDGLFHMVWTVSWNDKGIGYSNSRDLIHWSEQQFIPVMSHENEAMNCWAPEINYDPQQKQYIIYWSTTIPGRFGGTDSVAKYNHRLYFVTTRDFRQFTPTRLLYDRGFNVIDASIVQNGNQYVMFLKNETLHPSPQKNLRVAVSSNISTGYGEPSAPITGNYWAEGPTAIKIKNNCIVYFDKYRDKVYGAVQSKDLVKWDDISRKIKFPEGVRHGTVLKISREELKVLKAYRN